PDHGLSTKQMSRKKKEKSHTTTGLACNVDGSEKLPPTLNQFLGLSEEDEIGDSMEFEGGDKAIVVAVSQEMAEKRGEEVEVELDDDEDMGPVIEVSCAEVPNLCQKLEDACLQLGDANSPTSLDLVSHI
ncbi:hypothetical protein PAXRUDRAFT_149954, partial [Paxillus rubicundulus Ve08.2h10]